MIAVNRIFIERRPRRLQRRIAISELKRWLKRSRAPGCAGDSPVILAVISLLRLGNTGVSNAQRLLTLQAELNGKLAGGGDFMDTFRKHRGEQCRKAPVTDGKWRLQNVQQAIGWI